MPDLTEWELINLCDTCLWMREQGGGPEEFCKHCNAKLRERFPSLRARIDELDGIRT